MPEILYIVVPCYNEEEVLPETSRRLGAKLDKLMEDGRISPQSRVLFVDDGSRDRTWSLIEQLHARDPRFSGAKLSRNRGHQNALWAGLMTARGRCDVTISMDADLQDDIEAVDAMLDRRAEGCEVVYGVRSSRETDSFFKRFTAEGFYKLLAALGGEVVFNHADYRLLGRRALDALSEYHEQDLYLRGIVPMLGYKSDTVTYQRGERFAGESKYPLKKMLALAVNGITSLSAKPIRLLGGLGCVLFALGLLALLFALIFSLCGGHFPGWAVSSISAWAAAGLVLAALGVVGEYVGKTYLEAKARPRYFIERLLDDRDTI